MAGLRAAGAFNRAATAKTAMQLPEIIYFFDHTPDSLKQFFTPMGMKPYTATQVFEWVYQKGVIDPQAMTNLSLRDRAALAERVQFYGSRVVAHKIATDGTQKLLLRWPLNESAATDVDGSDALRLPIAGERAEQGRDVETVMIPTETRRTACLSSQVGCPVGCTFCASGIGGLEVNLRAGQIIEQAHRLNSLPDVGRLTNIVFMGMGEPLANFAAVTNAVRTLNAEWGFGISARRITISTVGLPAAIRKLTAFELPVRLALSLHAPNDELRRTLIPWANYTTIDELVDACDEYFQKTGREITFEYLLLRNVNDRPEHARELANVAQQLRANVNLIRYNEVKGLPFERPTTDDVHVFQKILRDAGVNTHIRASRGRDIAAACGQLRHERRVRAAGNDGY